MVARCERDLITLVLFQRTLALSSTSFTRFLHSVTNICDIKLHVMKKGPKNAFAYSESVKSMACEGTHVCSLGHAFVVLGINV